MKRLKIVADDKIPFLQGVFENFADIVYLPGAKITAQDVRHADALVTRTRTKCNAALLEGSDVKFIATATIGYDHIDTDYCDRNNIVWVNAPGCNSFSVQQYIITAIATLVHLKKLKFKELTLGVVGVGNVGSKVMYAAEALGMRVLVNDPPKEIDNYITTPYGNRPACDLSTLLAESDIVTLHVPLTKDGDYPTFHLANDEFFAKMKDGAVFINSSRGTVTDTEALRNAVNSNKLSEFILDVWETEPTPDPELLQKAFIATPHIAGYSTDGKAKGTQACVQQIAKFFAIKELQQWRPSNIPRPNPPMHMDFPVVGKDKTTEQIVYQAVTHTYPILEDSERLKRSPETFEKQRGDYWVRREFGCFNVGLMVTPYEMYNMFTKLGFYCSNTYCNIYYEG